MKLFQTCRSNVSKHFLFSLLSLQAEPLSPHSSITEMCKHTWWPYICFLWPSRKEYSCIQISVGENPGVFFLSWKLIGIMEQLDTPLTPANCLLVRWLHGAISSSLIITHTVWSWHTTMYPLSSKVPILPLTYLVNQSRSLGHLINIYWAPTIGQAMS